MFKHIADIISKISIKQRLTALGIVLISVVVISVAPKLISGLTQDNEELQLKVENQRNMIVTLSSNINQLNDQIIENQITCTDRFIKRESEILEMLTRIQMEAKRGYGKKIAVASRGASPDGAIIDNNDTIVVRGMVAPQTKTKVLVGDNPLVLMMLDEMIKNVENNIREN
jgi:hypothetical protein